MFFFAVLTSSEKVAYRLEPLSEANHKDNGEIYFHGELYISTRQER